MKKQPFYIICLIFSVLLFGSCNNKANGPESVAENFLKAYIATDYTSAANYCTPKISDYLKESLKEFKKLDSSMQTKIIEHTKIFSQQIDSIIKDKSTNMVNVYYSINKEISDSTKSGSTKNESKINGVLRLVKSDDSWKIDSLK
jgi:hypothetical protein